MYACIFMSSEEDHGSAGSLLVAGHLQRRHFELRDILD
jgi:hypothetical protein